MENDLLVGGVVRGDGGEEEKSRKKNCLPEAKIEGRPAHSIVTNQVECNQTMT